MFKFLPVYTHLAGFLALITPVAAASQPEPASIGAVPYRAGRFCAYDRVLAAPDGRSLAIWVNEARSILGTRQRLPPHPVIVGKMHDSALRSRDRLFHYVAPLRLYPIRWSSDGQVLHVRSREPEQRLMTMTSDGAASGDGGSLDPSWQRIDITAISHGDVDLLRTPHVIARTSRMGGADLIRGSATLHRDLELLGARHSDLELVRITADAVIPLGLNSSQTRMLTAFPGTRDLSKGIAYLGAPLRDSPRYLPYQLPLVDLSSGRIVGQFGPTDILIDQARALAPALAEFRRLHQAQGGVILDTSLSGTTMYVLTLSGRGDRTIFRLNAAGMTEQPLCTSLTGQQMAAAPGAYSPPQRDTGFRPHIRAFALTRAGREVLAPGHPIVVQYRLPGSGTRDAIIYFHGGPGGTIADRYIPEAVERLLSTQKDILVMEYSGSLGGGIGLTRRLPDQGLRAIEDDIDRLARWLGNREYRRIYVIGSSFGGVPAMMAVARHRELFAHAFFVAPALRLQDPEAWVAIGSGLAPVAADTQLAREEAYFGGTEGRTRFVADLDALVANAGLGANHHFYFGGNDLISQPEHLPAGITSPRHVYPGAVHAVMLAIDDIWRDIEAHLQ